MQSHILFFPPCAHHVFLSHCAEDRERLVLPLYSTLRSQRFRPWIDRHDYPYGRTSFAALRDEILKCRHTVFLVTEAMLAQPRGWCVIELAWADVLQENLPTTSGVLQNIILPLFFVPQGHALLPRTVWQSVRDRGVFHRSEDGDEVAWAAQQIIRFIGREEDRGRDCSAWLRADKDSRERINARPGLARRIRALDPAPLPPE